MSRLRNESSKHYRGIMKIVSFVIVILSLIVIPMFANVVSPDEASAFLGNTHEMSHQLKPLQVKTRRLKVNRWKELLGNVWTGVKVYYGTGSTKAYGFEVLGGSEKCPTLPSGRGIFVRYEDGSTEWKDRKTMVNPELFFILPNDPALKRFQWKIYGGC